jgi:GNAT superfamily N-acetyltransferase
MAITIRIPHALTDLQIEQLCDVLIDCVEGGASVSFMAPLARATARAFWQRVADDVERRARLVLIAEDDAGRIIGTVHLILDLPPNQPHRADVTKLLVQPAARRAGVASALVRSLETAARAAGRRVLVLDTVTGGPAECLYQSLGWQRVGEIPDYALFPHGALCSTTFFYKHV